MTALAYRNKYGRKIKRTKNLYRKKKTKAQKILGTVFLIIIILAIFFLGFCLGKPLLEFLEKNANREEPQWTPPTVTTTAEPQVSDEQPGETQTSAPETAPEQMNDEASTGFCAITAPSSALSNTTSLAAFAAKSKSEGYSAVIVVLKDKNGVIRYESDLEALKDRSELIQGTLRAGEIAKTLADNGLTAVAAISVLQDDAGCKEFPDMSFKINDGSDMSWLDYYTTGSALRWANPESKATVSYNEAIIAELKSAGFSEILLTGLIFPDLQNYDRQYLDARYFSADRYKMLEPLVPDGSYIEMKASDIIAEEYGRTAELLKDRAFLKDKQLVVRIDRSSFTAEAGYPAEAVGLIEDVLARTDAATAGLTVIPAIESDDFTAEELSAVKNSLEKAGYKACFVR